jgi:hypothetical protein
MRPRRVGWCPSGSDHHNHDQFLPEALKMLKIMIWHWCCLDSPLGKDYINR